MELVSLEWLNGSAKPLSGNLQIDQYVIIVELLIKSGELIPYIACTVAIILSKN